MSATIALVRIQLHFMKWPFWVMTVCVLVILFCSPQLYDTLVLGAGLFVFIGAVVSGALLFGEEYADGAREYLATRPVAPMHAFSVKVFFLLIYSIPSAWIIDTGFSFFHPLWRTIEYEQMVPLVWGILFGLSLWCAGTAILTKDTVRGMLYGPPSYFLMGIFAWLLPTPFYRTMAFLKTIHGGDEDLLALGPQHQFIDDLYVITLICLSPIVILGIVICIYRSIAFQRLTIPKSASVLFIFYLTAYCVAWKAIHVDTKPIAQMFKANRILAVDQTHKRIYTNDDYGFMNCQEIDHATSTIEVRDLSNPDQTVFTLRGSCTDCSILSSYRYFIHDDRYFVEIGRRGNDASFMDVHPIDDQGNPREANRVKFKGYLDNICFYDTDRVIATEYVLNASGQRDWSVNQRKSPKKLINLRTGIVESSIQGIPTDTWRQNWGNLCYETGILNSPDMDSRLDTRISLIKKDLTLYEVNTIPRIDSPNAVDINMLAYIPMDYENPCDGKVKESRVVLQDLHDPSSPQLHSLKFPYTFFSLPKYLYKTLSTLGIKLKDNIAREIDRVYLIMGNGIVCVQYFSRIAVWDVSNPNQPMWLGIIPCGQQGLGSLITQGFYSESAPRSIIRYPDGSIGFPINKCGDDSVIYRYEFPALMKEAHS